MGIYIYVIDRNTLDEDEEAHEHQPMAERHPTRERHSSKPYAPSPTRPRQKAGPPSLRKPGEEGSGPKREDDQDLSVTSTPSSHQQQPVLERPVCMVRGSLYIEDYVEGP